MLKSCSRFNKKLSLPKALLLYIITLNYTLFVINNLIISNIIIKDTHNKMIFIYIQTFNTVRDCPIKSPLFIHPWVVDLKAFDCMLVHQRQHHKI